MASARRGDSDKRAIGWETEERRRAKDGREEGESRKKAEREREREREKERIRNGAR